MFEFQVKFDTEQFLPLSSFQRGSVLTTPFAKASRLLAKVIARDSLGAATKRSDSPFVDNIVVNALSFAGTDTPPDAADTVSNLLSSGGSSEDVLRFASSLTESAAEVDFETASPQAKAWLLDTQGTMLDLMDSTRTEDADPSFTKFQANTLSSLLESAKEIQDAGDPAGAEYFEKAALSVANLLADTKAAILKKAKSPNNPLLSTFLPEGTDTITLKSLQNILKAIAKAAETDFTRRRRLDPAAANTNQQSIDTVRTQLKNLVGLILAGSLPESGPRSVSDDDVILVAAVMNPNGDGSVVLSVDEFDPMLPPTQFIIPPGVGAGLTAANLINVQAVRFRYNVREIITPGGEYNYTLDPFAPGINASDISEILALQFGEDAEVDLTPTDLPFPIQINFTLSWAQMPANPTDNQTGLGCGSFDEEGNIWTSSGCSISSYRYPVSETDMGWQVCACNHATDYAVWQTFVENLLNPVVIDLEALLNLTVISALVIGILIPAIFAVWIFGFAFSRSKDFKDRYLVHLGTFVSISRKKIELRDRQRRYV
jgi:hypothetical protein